MKVSIIVPCYLQAQYLDQALQSVLEQSYQDWECLIINDGSPDDTEVVAKPWVAKDKRFTYYFKDNGGLSQARNYGIERAIGDYILPLDADDYLSNNYIEHCVNELGNKNVKLVYGKVEQFGIRTGIWDLGLYHYHDLLVYNMIHCAAMYRKKDWQRISGYDEAMVLGLEDWEFWIRLLNEHDQGVLLKEITFFYRIKATSMITQLDKEKEKEVKAYVVNKHAAKYVELLNKLNRDRLKLNNELNSKSFLGKRFIKLLLGMKN
jgi:glycosyltransferase involved in cell wall biosynthesis